MNEPTQPLPAYHFASDIHGVRHLIVDDDSDCTGWRIEVSEPGGARHIPFRRSVVFGDGPQVNLLGYGPAREAWMAAIGWAAVSAEIRLPDESRHPVRGFAL
ncbi:hypothetical protein [Micromonospora deserti]|uniref:Uncharacterized protein n=1 Tax=Micromonospora deserti TaxID=2070366 RepID=A0A2W2CQ99_9ACTN|nr:hypothetical protein [Micromonospora deserti]PZG01636.1 hypothetical protein C1I99_06115 [Micromonospora deserti]